MHELLNLARRFNLSGYDAAYLALAHSAKVLLATNDSALAYAARQCGVGLLRV